MNLRHPRLRRRFAVPESCFLLVAQATFDRCTASPSLLLPPAAVGLCPQSRCPALLAGCRAAISYPNKKDGPSLTNRLFLVGVTGFEPAASCSQSRRATNCATPRYYSVFALVALFALLRFPKLLRDESLAFLTAAPKNARCFVHWTRSCFLPKAGALPTALHPDGVPLITDIYYSTFLYFCQVLKFLAADILNSEGFFCQISLTRSVIL